MKQDDRMKFLENYLTPYYKEISREIESALKIYTFLTLLFTGLGTLIMILEKNTVILFYCEAIFLNLSYVIYFIVYRKYKDKYVYTPSLGYLHYSFLWVLVGMLIFYIAHIWAYISKIPWNFSNVIAIVIGLICSILVLLYKIRLYNNKKLPRSVVPGVALLIVPSIIVVRYIVESISDRLGMHNGYAFLILILAIIIATFVAGISMILCLNYLICRKEKFDAYCLSIYNEKNKK